MNNNAAKNKIKLDYHYILYIIIWVSILDQYPLSNKDQGYPQGHEMNDASHTFCKHPNVQCHVSNLPYKYPTSQCRAS